MDSPGSDSGRVPRGLNTKNESTQRQAGRKSRATRRCDARDRDARAATVDASTFITQNVHDARSVGEVIEQRFGLAARELGAREAAGRHRQRAGAVRAAARDVVGVSPITQTSGALKRRPSAVVKRCIASPTRSARRLPSDPNAPVLKNVCKPADSSFSQAARSRLPLTIPRTTSARAASAASKAGTPGFVLAGAELGQLATQRIDIGIVQHRVPRRDRVGCEPVCGPHLFEEHRVGLALWMNLGFDGGQTIDLLHGPMHGANPAPAAGQHRAVDIEEQQPVHDAARG
jgi:hypothetical protein